MQTGSQPNISSVHLTITLRNSAKPSNSMTITKAVTLPERASFSLRSTVAEGILTDISLWLNSQKLARVVPIWRLCEESGKRHKKRSKFDSYTVVQSITSPVARMEPDCRPIEYPEGFHSRAERWVQLQRDLGMESGGGDLAVLLP